MLALDPLRTALLTFLRRARAKLVVMAESTTLGYRLSLWFRYGILRATGAPVAKWHNAVLCYKVEVDDCVNQLRKCSLPVGAFHPKNWDALAALDVILNSTKTNARILDAGGEVYSLVCPWLFLSGYRRLTVGNLVFRKPFRRGPIQYMPLDLTRTPFPDEHFDAITCLSVIEHGVDLKKYFQEMSRILRPGGHLVTSTDYFDPAMNIQGLTAYGTPVQVFCAKDILEMFRLAEVNGFELTGPIDLACKDRVVRWERVGLEFTFIVFTLKKR